MTIMDNVKTMAIAATCFYATSTYAVIVKPDFDAEVNKLFAAHYQQYHDLEYFSGAALSIYIPTQEVKNYYIGQVSRDDKSEKVSPSTLFQIGSITKSFTAAVILQLESEGKLSLDAAIQDLLPQYPKWSAVNIKSLLNMTSGLPNYSDTPLFNTEVANKLSRVFSNEDLIGFVYPASTLSPPLKTGYFYTNTSYILLDLITQKVTEKPFQDELLERTIKRAHLDNTFYYTAMTDRALQGRLAHGYNYNQYDNPVLVGQDVSDSNLSWTGAAGGLVSNTEDVVNWVKALFVDDSVLDNKQRHKLMQLISTNTGKPLKKTSSKEPRGFGLGVVGAFDTDSQMKRYWFYEGETLGFRALYLYIACNGVIVSSAFNSSTNAENDHAGALMKQVYKLALKTYPELSCKTEYD